MQNKELRCNGFTLAELLIALLLLGLITAFSIPKVLVASTNAKWNASAKEAASMFSGAYQAYKFSNTVTTGTSISDLLPYMNYVKEDTTSLLDETPTAPWTVDCSDANITCIQMYTGGTLHWDNILGKFDGTSSLDTIRLSFDPDGKTAGSGTGMSIVFWLYYNGRLRTYGGIEPSTCAEGVCTFAPTPIRDPSWFSW